MLFFCVSFFVMFCPKDETRSSLSFFFFSETKAQRGFAHLTNPFYPADSQDCREFLLFFVEDVEIPAFTPPFFFPKDVQGFQECSLVR